jgi:hypothetical protein
MFRKRCPAFLILLLLASGSRLAAQEQTQKFEAEIQVREIGLVVEPPDKGTFKPADLLVFDGGDPRQVLKAEPLRPEAGARPWHIVLYFDQVLAGPETARGAALALARQARELTGLGSVEVAIADPEPRVALATTADAAGISNALGEIADQARKKINPRPAGQETAPRPTDIAALRRQLDRLTAFLAARPGTGVQALFLVADGFAPPPGEADFISAPDTGDPAPPGTAAASLRETSRFLSASGWITFAMPFRDTQPDRERLALSDMERLRVMAGGSEHDNSAPPVIAMRPPNSGPLLHERVVDVFTRPDTAPLRALVQPTAGTVIGFDEQLRPAISNLGHRWRVWYQAPETLNGKLHTVEVRLPAATTPLRGQHWVKSSPPEELDAARARLLAARSPVSGSELKVDAAVTGTQLKVRIAPAGAASAGPLRLSIAYDNRSEVRHVVIPGTSLEKGWEHTLDLQPPTGAARVSVVAEDLTRGNWGGTAVDLPRPGS